MKKFYTFTKIFVVMLMTTMAFTSCEEDDSYDAELLSNGYWQGYLGVYYQDRWRVSGTEYSTEMHFSHKGAYYTSGRGYEVDYDTRNPYNNYAYCTFKWFIVDGEITLIYDDDVWNPVYISRYSLYSNRFSGYIYDGTNRNIHFDFSNVNTSDWDGRYSGYGRWGDLGYYSRQVTRSAEDAEPVPYVDRSELAIQQSGEADAMSVASGTFAAAFQK